MAIVKMKRLRLLGLRADREQLLRPLQSLGCVEISEPAIDLSDPAWSALAKPEGAGLAKAREQSQKLESALGLLARYAPAKERGRNADGRPGSGKRRVLLRVK